MRRKYKEEEVYVYICLITLLYSINQHNTVKQPHSNKNISRMEKSLLESKEFTTIDNHHFYHC